MGSLMQYVKYTKLDSIDNLVRYAFPYALFGVLVVNTSISFIGGSLLLKLNTGSRFSLC